MTSDFLKRRALSLHRSGRNPVEIAGMLHIDPTTARRWIKPLLSERRLTRQAVDYAEKMGREPDLPTLSYVPHIELTANSKYIMRAP